VANGSWTATTNATWLHLSAANQSGTGSTNVIFTFDVNNGPTRTNTLTIAGQPVSITQAGSPYVAITNMTTLVSTGLSSPYGLATGGGGNIYIADTGNNAVKEWIAASNTVITLVSFGLSSPHGVAVDDAGNIYIADSGNNAVKEWIAASNTVITLVSSGLSSPYGVAVDGAGNVYIADYNNNAIKEWTAANNNVTTLVPSGLNHPTGVAVDPAGNVFIVDNFNYTIKKWTPANLGVTTSVSSGLLLPRGVAVDMAGNLYIANTGNNNIKKWTVATNGVATLVSSGLNQPSGVAVDGSGNVYIADTSNNAIKELPRAFVDPTTKTEGVSAGSDSLPVMLPASANLTGPLAPTSDALWLTISSVNNGVVTFAFAANTSPSRTAHINLLKQSIAVTQPAIIPPIISGSKFSISGTFQFSFSNNQGASFTVWTTTNISLPFTNWTPLGSATNNGFGQYQFADVTATNVARRFYRVSSP
jgi:DNA-binding beta-propeller fold protein YncE